MDVHVSKALCAITAALASTPVMPQVDTVTTVAMARTAFLRCYNDVELRFHSTPQIHSPVKGWRT